MTHVPSVRAFTSAPLRNRTRAALKAAPAEVWALVGDLARFPEFASGLERVEAELDSTGKCVAYVCCFKATEEGAEGIVSREAIRWYEPNRGFASSSEQANPFGLSNDLHLVTIEPAEGGATVTWEEYYDAVDLDMMKANFDHALADGAANLVRRFGGEIVERYMEK